MIMFLILFFPILMVDWQSDEQEINEDGEIAENSGKDEKTYPPEIQQIYEKISNLTDQLNKITSKIRQKNKKHLGIFSTLLNEINGDAGPSNAIDMSNAGDIDQFEMELIERYEHEKNSIDHKIAKIYEELFEKIKNYKEDELRKRRLHQITTQQAKSDAVELKFNRLNELQKFETETIRRLKIEHGLLKTIKSITANEMNQKTSFKPKTDVYFDYVQESEHQGNIKKLLNDWSQFVIIVQERIKVVQSDIINYSLANQQLRENIQRSITEVEKEYSNVSNYPIQIFLAIDHKDWDKVQSLHQLLITHNEKMTSYKYNMSKIIIVPDNTLEFLEEIETELLVDNNEPTLYHE
ncbi:unnamed protein product [Caenorhabditis angaria]|uniref:Uncharacterized protein n=1 Tax=Caenorhabditis angaria TaxID=860376 RepID=A0A9P1ND18_9PELO|nr:unnamed protein product [Caenorhabditis angaria]